MLERLKFDLTGQATAAMPYLFNGLVPKGSVVVLAGPPGCGKTTFLMQTGVALSLGTEFLGHTPEGPLGVVFLPFEDGQPSINRRLVACAKNYSSGGSSADTGLLNRHFHVLRPSLDVGSKVFRGLAADLDMYLAELVRQRVEAGLVILDPLSSVLEGDENDAVVFRDLFSAARQLAERHNVSIILSHHTRKSAVGERRTRSPTPPLAEMIRGSSAIVAGARLVLALVPTGSQPTGGAGVSGISQTANLVVVKSNDGPVGEIIRLMMDTETGLWGLDEAPPVPASSTSTALKLPGRLTRRDQVLQVLAACSVDGSGPGGRRLAHDVFQGDPDPGTGLRSALRDLRVKGLVDTNDAVTDSGRAHLARFK